jgi:hypothetical protein
MKIIVFVGAILIAVGMYVFQSDMTVTINRRRANAEDSKTARAYVGSGLMALGGLFAVGGIVGIVRGKKLQKRNEFILLTGIATQASVTFVDKNWSVLVNRNPIYSIVEYTFSDKSGNVYTRKISNISSEIVIRKQIQVGTKIPIKYLPENPTESVMVLG